MDVPQTHVAALRTEAAIAVVARDEVMACPRQVDEVACLTASAGPGSGLAGTIARGVAEGRAVRKGKVYWHMGPWRANEQLRSSGKAIEGLEESAGNWIRAVAVASVASAKDDLPKPVAGPSASSAASEVDQQK